MMKRLIPSLLLSIALTTQAAEDLEALLGDSTSKGTHAVQQDALVIAVTRLIGKTNGEQNLFIRHMEKSDWNLALIQYSMAFGGTEFERTASGKALRAYLAYQSELKISSLEDLFSIDNPESMDAEITGAWKKAVVNDTQTWNLARLQWKPYWTTIFGVEREVRFQISNGQKLSIDALYDLAKKVGADDQLRADIEWQLVLKYALQDEPIKAAKILNSMMKNSKTVVSMDLMNMTAARLLYQNAYFEPAIKYYEKIKKNSEYWVEAQEEIAWSYLKRGQPQNALAVGETLMHPGLVGLSGPEAYFVKAIGHLKVCDYTQVLESLALYPKNFKERLNRLTALSQNPDNEHVKFLMTQLKSGKITEKNLKEKLQFLPRRVLQDKKLYDLAQFEKSIESEANTAEKIYIKSLAQSGLQASFDLVKQRSVQRAQDAQALSLQRVKELSEMESNEIKKILNKLHIVEAEVIQQVGQAERIAKLNKLDTPVKKGSTGSAQKDVLVFPADKEKWFDEISNYRVSVKNGCVSKAESNANEKTQ